MKHECGGEINFVSITKIEKNKADVLLICKNCGITEKSLHYLYNDITNEKVKYISSVNEAEYWSGMK